MQLMYLCRNFLIGLRIFLLILRQKFLPLNAFTNIYLCNALITPILLSIQIALMHAVSVGCVRVYRETVYAL